MDNLELIKAIRAGADPAEIIPEIYSNCLPIIKGEARRYKRDREDMEQEGYFALLDAVEQYDLDGPATFETYARFFIRGRMSRYHATTAHAVRIPEYMQGQLRKYKRVASAFYARIGREPTAEELRRLLGVSEDDLRQILHAELMASPTSLDAPIESKNGDTLTLLSLVPADPEEELEEMATRSADLDALARRLWDAVDSLPGKGPAVMRGLYQERKTPGELAEQLGVSYSRIKQIEIGSIIKLKTAPTASFFRQYYDDYSPAQDHHVTCGEFSRTQTSETEFRALRNTQKRIYGPRFNFN